eukprot:scaffold11589_cov117-Cylindrotheca_fusiformis.AAC.11
MDQQNRQKNGAHSQPSPGPIAPNHASTSNQQHSVANQHDQRGLTSSHLLELMTNPALAAAAAASPLFPPAAIITNPGALYAMPDAFASNGGVNMQNTHGAVPQHHANSQGNNNQMNMTNQQHAYQFQIGQHIASMQAHGVPPSIFPQPTSDASSFQAKLAAAPGAFTYGTEPHAAKETKKGRRKKDLSPTEKAKQNRDRNREHARSTRMRKKAYIQRLKELVEGLHAERTEEVRKRRVAIQHLADVQNVRRAVIRSFLQFLASYERDKRKWSTIIEDDFWLKQPVTPYRCFRRSEIEKNIRNFSIIEFHCRSFTQECRMSRGLDSVVADAASIAVMINGVGSRTARWTQIKREDFFSKEEERTGRKPIPSSVAQQNEKLQHAVSSLSASSSNSSNTGSSGEEAGKRQAAMTNAKSVRNSNGNSRSSGQPAADLPGEFHDYNAKPLPDPMLADSERSSNDNSDDSPEESIGSLGETKRVSTDSSSGDDSAAARSECRPLKRQKVNSNEVNTPPTYPRISASSSLPRNIAKKGGISHNVHAMFSNTSSTGSSNPRLSVAPAIRLPPFSGIGKKSQMPLESFQSKPPSSTQSDTMPGRVSGSSNGASDDPAVLISGDVETSSSISSKNRPQVRAYFHVNEDDLILMEDILMCPFVFRTKNAVRCGALAECVMPGMLRAHFSTTNKLKSVEMTYDAMGFMQQLERASGNETNAQIIPGSLEMALSPNAGEARVITLAEQPFQIVNVNEAWTKLTKYTQMEVEGVALLKLLEGEVVEGTASDHCNLPYNLEDLSEGRCACATRLHVDKEGQEYVDFICSYPLTK